MNVPPSDSANRKPILSYHPNDCDKVRKTYLQKGSYQLRNQAFFQTKMSNYMQHFDESLFAAYPNWLEYSIKEDVACCLCCYLLKNCKFGHSGGDMMHLQVKDLEIGEREVHLICKSVK